MFADQIDGEELALERDQCGEVRCGGFSDFIGGFADSPEKHKHLFSDFH